MGDAELTDEELDAIEAKDWSWWEVAGKGSSRSVVEHLGKDEIQRLVAALRATRTRLAAAEAVCEAAVAVLHDAIPREDDPPMYEIGSGLMPTLWAKAGAWFALGHPEPEEAQ